MVQYQDHHGRNCEIFTAKIDNSWIHDILYGRVRYATSEDDLSSIVNGSFTMGRSDAYCLLRRGSNDHRPDLLLGFLLDPINHLLYHYFRQCAADANTFLVLSEAKIRRARGKRRLAQVAQLRLQKGKSFEKAMHNIRKSAETFDLALEQRESLGDREMGELSLSESDEEVESEEIDDVHASVEEVQAEEDYVSTDREERRDSCE